MNICENCAICCFNTEMQLSKKDIKRIEKRNPWKWKKKDFTKKEKDFIILKNIENHCIFLDPIKKKCKIYEYRPMGCRFYPLIYDPIKEKCTLDKDCPKRKKFFPNHYIKIEKCKQLKKWINTELLNQ